MSKIEEVARAIYAEMPNGAYVWEPNTAGGSSQVFRADAWEDAPDRHEDCLRQARAALLAIREPDEGMVEAMAKGMYVEFEMGLLERAPADQQRLWRRYARSAFRALGTFIAREEAREKGQAAIDHALTQENGE